jgi:hypothetical protein
MYAGIPNRAAYILMNSLLWLILLQKRLSGLPSRHKIILK